MRTFTRWLLWCGAGISLMAAGIIASPQWGLLPHRICLLGNTWLMWAYVLPNAVISVGYLIIPVVLYIMVRARPEIFFKPVLIYWAASFIFFCSLTHVMDNVVVWWPAYYSQIGVLWLCAIATIGFIVALSKSKPELEHHLAMQRRYSELEQRYAELEQKLMELRGGGGG